MVATPSSPRRSGRARSSVSRYAPESAPKAVRKPSAKATPAAKAAPAKKAAPKAAPKKASAGAAVDGVLTYELAASREGYDVRWSEAADSQGLTLRGDASLKSVIGKFCALDKLKVVGRIAFADIDEEPYADGTTLDDAMGDEQGWVSAKFR